MLIGVKMKIEIFKTENGYGYKVGGIYQEYDPDLDGFVEMTEERALECANVIFERLQSSFIEENIVNEGQAVS
jgi:hypothetical protein